MKNFGKYIVLIISVLFVFSSCRRPVEKRIAGTWGRLNIEDMNKTKDADGKYAEYWYFGSDGVFVVHQPIDLTIGHSDPVTDSSRYLINARFRRDYINLEIENPDVKYYSGFWEIVYIKKKTMMLVKRPDEASLQNQGHFYKNPDRKGGLLFREFVRIEDVK